MMPFITALVAKLAWQRCIRDDRFWGIVLARIASPLR
jgi:hypothetical protein